ncbi:MAG: exodeoxyribonuclease alpha subunit [Frankiales bacterium]|nr:exodeoxyribonuclease alpha subunit [Frankiales bacterium]
MLAASGKGLLRRFNEAAVLDAADVHVATRLSALAQEDNEIAQLALGLAVRSVRHGSVVLDLDHVHTTVSDDETVDASTLPWPEDWSALDDSPLVDGPLHREGSLLWLDAYWRQEVAVADDLLRRIALPVSVDRAALATALARLWPGDEPDDQRLAAAVCALSQVAVLGGGPGTGKTTTVARLLVALRDCSPQPLRIALAAPTGRASARLAASLLRPDPVLTATDNEFLGALSSSTLHRLLGIRRGSARVWHDESNRLPVDVLVVDEASMVSLSLFAKVLVALRPHTRLVLVGDPDQLASVEAGAVLSDLVSSGRSSARVQELAAVVPHDPDTAAAGSRLRDGIALLTTSRRYETAGPIDLLAQAIRNGDGDLVVDRLDGVAFHEVADDAEVPVALLRPHVIAQLTAVVDAARAGDSGAALQALASHRLLCAHRRGPRGVSTWTELIHAWLLQDVPGIAPRRDGRFAGQPLLVTSNDYDNGLWNGDTGVVVESGGELVAAFDGHKPIRLGSLGDVRPMYAMTVHRAQGSQFPSVTVLLPPASSPLGTRETLYTAVTRAETEVTVIGSEAGVRAAVDRRVQRASGLRARLAAPP